MTVNLQRNEVAVELGGQTLTLRASFEAVVAIEADTGQGIITLGRKFKDLSVSVTELVAMIYHGQRGYVGYAHPEPMSKGRVGQLVMERGAIQTAMDIMAFPAVAMNGVSLGKPAASEATL